MRELPEIVKRLREEEKLGRLSSSPINLFQIEEKNTGYAKEGIHAFEKSNLKTELMKMLKKIAREDNFLSLTGNLTIAILGISGFALLARTLSLDVFG